jgi:hypothetical protein
MSKPQVVIVRKDKKIRHKVLHAAAFAVTGGASGIVTAAEAASHAQYNARTRQLQEQSSPRPAQVSKAKAVVGLVCLSIIVLCIIIAIAVG